jgi:hypothetical protein
MPLRVLIAAADPAATALAEQVAAAGFVCAKNKADADVLLCDADAGIIQDNALPALYLCGDPASCPGPALQKPVRLAELLAALKRFESAATFALGEWVFDAAARRLTHKEGRDIPLTEKESALLSCLLDETPYSREALLAKVWGYGEGVDTHTLETHLYRLRAKLKEVMAEEDWKELA